LGKFITILSLAAASAAQIDLDSYTFEKFL